mmetsp:Transcript_34875/g.69599  ORF Transcript_34875/g.69599 Transcript_34875/m.69599 type:complete len:231 (+) Transcript_34875:508-1200(+)
MMLGRRSGQPAQPAGRRASRTNGIPYVRRAATSVSSLCASATRRASPTTSCDGWAACRPCTIRALPRCSSPVPLMTLTLPSTHPCTPAWSGWIRLCKRSCTARSSARRTPKSAGRFPRSCCAPSSTSCSVRLPGAMPVGWRMATSRRTVSSQRRSTKRRTSTCSSSATLVSRLLLPLCATRSCRSGPAARRLSCMLTTSTSGMAQPTTSGRSAPSLRRWRAATATPLCTS